ncbi:hypothetical_protein [Leishmania major strain Friedlin]|nr:hypothetical_protein [Leishmania major strain Friedlin]
MKSSAFVLDKSLQAKCVDHWNGKGAPRGGLSHRRASTMPTGTQRCRDGPRIAPPDCSAAQTPRLQRNLLRILKSSTGVSGSGLAIHVAHATVIMSSGCSAARPQKRQFPGPFSMASLEVQALQERREHRWPASKHRRCVFEQAATPPPWPN